MKWWLTLLFVLMGLASAEVQPEFPELDLPERYAVILKGRPVSKLFWRDGRPFGTLEELGPRLNLPSDSSVEVDILAVVAEKGYTAELADGVLTLAEGRPEYVPPPAWATNEPVRRPKPSQPTSSGSKRTGPDLTYYVKCEPDQEEQTSTADEPARPELKHRRRQWQKQHWSRTTVWLS